MEKELPEVNEIVVVRVIKVLNYGAFAELLEYDDEKGFVQLEEWLFAEKICKFCNRVGCCYCIITCYTCGNIGEDSHSVCVECRKKYPNSSIVFKLVPCEYHTWYVCNDHIDEKCASCTANKNYDRYEQAG